MLYEISISNGIICCYFSCQDFVLTGVSSIQGDRRVQFHSVFQDIDVKVIGVLFCSPSSLGSARGEGTRGVLASRGRVCVGAFFGDTCDQFCICIIPTIDSIGQFMVSGSAILLLAMSSIQHNCYFFSKHDMVTESFISFQSSFYLLYLAQIQYDLCLINRADQINDFSFKSLLICLFVFAFLQNFSFILCLCLRWFVVQMWLIVIEEKTFVDSCEECGNILKWVQVLFFGKQHCFVCSASLYTSLWHFRVF